ncbi:MAG: MFS transporter [Burkholderiales bacterium]|nr:MFS transporter [Burkholderiales bacterium]
MREHTDEARARRAATHSGDDGAGLGRALMTLFTVFVFATAGTIHFQTPMLAELGREFAAEPVAVAWVPTLSFGGFLAGSLLLVPLGDRYDKRTIVFLKLAGLTASMIAMAAAPTLAVLAAASFLAGVCASVSQDVIALTAELAAPGERGAAIGTLLSGLFVGILFARLAGGFVAAELGWRWMYVISAAMLAAAAPPLAARMPHAPARTQLAYAALMRSLVRMLRARADLRRASAVQFMLGICYGGFWATLAPMMTSLHGVGPAAVGLVGIPGAAGVLVARAAGRWMDRSGVAPVVTTGILLVMAAYVVFGLAGLFVAAVAVGAALQDCGLRAAMVANQALITGTDPEARSRSNTVFAVHIWGGNATGAFVASTAWALAGWPGVVASGLAASLAALAVQRRLGARAGRTR